MVKNIHLEIDISIEFNDVGHWEMLARILLFSLVLKLALKNTFNQ